LTIARRVLLALAAFVACGGAAAQSFEWESRDSLVLQSSASPPRVRLDDARRELDDLRDYASADDYRTIRVRGKNGRAVFRRVPTEEFAARIERAELERDTAEAELRALERSLY
jgi:hypothetical protein